MAAAAATMFMKTSCTKPGGGMDEPVAVAGGAMYEPTAEPVPPVAPVPETVAPPTRPMMMGAAVMLPQPTPKPSPKAVPKRPEPVMGLR